MSSSSKGEAAVNQFLEAEGVEFERERIFSGLCSSTDNSPLPVDFAVNINGFVGIIEYNGSQHYKPVGESSDAFDAWNRLSKNGSTRLNYSKKKNIPLLVIHYKDFKRVEEVVAGFLKDMRRKTKNETVKYTKHTKGFFVSYPYQAFKKATVEQKRPPFEISSSAEQNEVYPLPNDAVITSQAYLDELQFKHANHEQSIKKFQSVISDMVTRINDLQNTNQELEQTINEMSAQMAEQSMATASHNVVTFEGEFRISPSNRSQLTEDARHFIKHLSHRFDNDWNKVRNFIGDNYQERISVKTIKKVCSTPEDF